MRCLYPSRSGNSCPIRLGARTSAPNPQSQPSTALMSDSASPLSADQPCHSAFADSSSPETPPNTVPNPSRFGTRALLNVVSFLYACIVLPASPETPSVRLGMGSQSKPAVLVCLVL